MIGLLKKYLAKNAPDNEPAYGRRQAQVAACALLLEMAGIDGEFSENERKKIVSILRREYDLSTEDAEELIRLSHGELENSIDLWGFANLINNNFAREEKLSVIEMLWRIVYTDGVLEKHEDYLAHKLGKLLRVSHRELIDAKVRVLDEHRGGTAGKA